MKQFVISIFATILMSMVGIKVYAYDIEVENADGVTIYYNYINNGTELEVKGYDYYSEVVNIPETVTYMNRTRSVTSIGSSAFSYCIGLTSVTIPNSVAVIGNYAFQNCSGLTSVTIPNSVTSIGNSVFSGCSGLTSVTIPNSVTAIGNSAFEYCSGLTSVTIGNSVTSIGDYAFSGCSDLTSVTIPNSVTSIGGSAFEYCIGLTSVTIPNSVTSIGDYAFYGRDMPTVVSLIENPSEINGKQSIFPTFSTNTFNNATLYVPVGTIDKYKATEGWKDFLFIEEGTGGSGPATPQKCEKPTISYQNGKLTFNCETEGATCQSTITDTDITSYSSNEIQLGVTYNISVYATKAGYENSDVATATLCWIDVEPKTEGVENDIAQVRANAILVQSNNGTLNVSGADAGTSINVYTTSGVMVSSAKAAGTSTSIATNLRIGEIAIVKIGGKSVKVVMK